MARAFVTLDGLRGIAALAVLTRHAPAFFASIAIILPAEGALPERPAGPFFESYLAVDFFFLLSGFVLSHAYEKKLVSGWPLRQFIRARLIRLYPLYLLSLVFPLIVALSQLVRGQLGLEVFSINAATALILLPSPLTFELFPLNYPAWSLFFELIANCLFGALARWLTTRFLIFLLLFFCVLLIYVVVHERLGFGAIRSGAMIEGFFWISFGAGLVRVLYSFTAGVLLYRFHAAWGARFRFLPLVAPVFLTAILVSAPSLAYQKAFDLLAIIVCFPVIVWMGANSHPGRLLTPIFGLIGAASYAIYVFQVPLYGMFSRMLSMARLHDLSWPWALAYTATIFLIAVIADRYYDIPVRRWLTARPARRAIASSHFAN